MRSCSISSVAVLFITVAVLGFAGALAQTPYFTEISAEVGLIEIDAFRIGIADVNGDRYPDLLIHATPDEMGGDVLDKQFLYLNMPGDDSGDPHDRRFVDFTEESGIRANRAATPDGRHSSSGIFADVDNDGDPDLLTIVYLHRNYSLNQGTNELMLNDGEGHFVLAHNSTFHTEPIYNTPAAVFLDYDNDGNLDLYIGNWYFNDVLSQDHLYHGYGDGSFTNVTAASGIEGTLTSVYAVAAMDWNDDGYMDLFAPSYSHTAPAAGYHHWRNNQDGTFTDVTDTSCYGEYGGYDSGRSSFGTMPRDYDNDGDIDFLEVWVHGNRVVHTTTATNVDYVCSWDFDRITGRDDEDPMPRHHGDHHAQWFDIENDGLSDFTLTESGYDNNRIYIFKQEADNTFHPVTAETGLNVINDENLPPGNASPFDFDLDGDEDLVVGFGNAAGMQLWRNDAGALNHWLSISLAGAGGQGHSNCSAIGARLKVEAGSAAYTREIYAGHGHQCPQVPTSQHFGLGDSTIVNSIEVAWPNTSKTRLKMIDVAADQFITIREDPITDPPDKGVRLNMPSIRFSRGDACWLDAYLYNSGPQPLEQIALIIILDIYGEYFFFDGWTQDLDLVLVDLPAGVRYFPVIPEFEWPDTGGDALSGLVFWAAMLNETYTDVLGGSDGIGHWTFGFGP